MSAPVPVFQSKGVKSKVPNVTKQSDRHTQLAGLLLKAEQAPDSLERMLAVCRVLLCWLTDLLRPGRGFQETPLLTLGFHALSHRDLAEQHKGDPVRVYLQEGVSFDPGYGPTKHKKYGSVGASDLASFKMAFTPLCCVKVQRGGILGGGGAVYVECAFEGSGQLHFERHAEMYAFHFPALLFTNPLAEACPLDLEGVLGIECAATGLNAQLRFKPFRAGQQHQAGRHPVKGQVSRLMGEGSTRVAAVRGDWSGIIEVEGLEFDGAGVLFDASQYTPLLKTTVNLADSGARAMPRLWAAILQEITFTDPAQAAQHGKRAEQMAQQLPLHLRKSLGYEVEEGPKAGKDKSEEESTVATSASAGACQRHMAPCLEAQAQAGSRPHYFSQLLLQALEVD